MKTTLLSMSIFFAAPLAGMNGQPPFHLTYEPKAQYEPFRVKDGISFSFDIASSYFDAKARLTAAKDYNHPDIKRYDNWKKYCEDSAQEWATKQTYNPIYRADLKNPVHVAALGLGTTAAALIIVKIINGALDWTWKKVNPFK